MEGVRRAALRPVAPAPRLTPPHQPSTAPAPALDGKHVVVGRVVEGFEVLERLSADVASADGAPRAAAVVAACGQLNSE